jgi:hypothetical protein
MIHYHGTPITPREELLKLRGKHFCVSHAAPQNFQVCMEIGQSVMFDNGAFSKFTKGKSTDWGKYYDWLEPVLCPPHWAVLPDMIGGAVADQKTLLEGWPYPKNVSAPVWHIHLDTDYLLELTDDWERVCFGSSGQFWKTGSEEWTRRVDTAWEVLLKRRVRPPAIHMLRAMDQACKGRWPFASADSTNIGRNYAGRCPNLVERCSKIDAMNPAPNAFRVLVDWAKEDQPAALPLVERRHRNEGVYF